jgi:hypothetical protein
LPVFPPPGEGSVLLLYNIYTSLNKIKIIVHQLEAENPVIRILVGELVRVEKGVADKAGAALTQYVIVYSKLEVLQQLAHLALALHRTNLPQEVT